MQTTVKMFQQNKIPEVKQKLVMIPSSISLNKNIENHRQIKDLQIGESNWTIICRVIELDQKKITKNDKNILVVNLELIDRAGMSIHGALFDDVALQFKEYLAKGKVYKISNGKISEQKYYKPINEKFSPNKITFTQQSSFEEFMDDASIPKNKENFISIKQCIKNRILEKTLNIICNLEKIEDTFSIIKDDLILKKTNLLVSDLNDKINLPVILWDQKLIPNHLLIGKTIILLNFKLEYHLNNLLNLKSTINSDIIPAQSHPSYLQKINTRIQNSDLQLDELKPIKIQRDNKNILTEQIQQQIKKETSQIKNSPFITQMIFVPPPINDSLKYQDRLSGDFMTSLIKEQSSLDYITLFGQKRSINFDSKKLPEPLYADSVVKQKMKKMVCSIYQKMIQSLKYFAGQMPLNCSNPIPKITQKSNQFLLICDQLHVAQTKTVIWKIVQDETRQMNQKSSQIQQFIEGMIKHCKNQQQFINFDD